ncbi:universal stress protein [Gudongella sp. DL1XJH-153]|uniref:universal stress protein n=1 Tax=Gudongella sp. DL1XJH-153 TaxID=3409804 RepID=UPI003BB59DA9
MNRILVPVDGSPASMKAALMAIDIAKTYGSEITFFSVVRRPELIGTAVGGGIGYAGDLRKIVEGLTDKQGKMLDEFVEGLNCTDVNCTKDILVGEPYEEIISHAKYIEADLIVMGRRGYTKVQRFFLGSVSHRVVSEAPCPVLVVNEDIES